MSMLKNIAVRAEPYSYAALRVVAGLMFSFHGMQKILRWHASSPTPPTLGSQIWFGGVIELVCGLLIAIGFWTRASAFLSSGTMAVAYTQFHWKFAIAGGMWLPGVNKGEMALLYCFLFLFIFSKGGGFASVDDGIGNQAR